ncbi:MAG: pantetheine-phosphate adenylyltransferase [Planctomycetaceae bacterium]|jgi:pantetheine-phosphate adenylyltransferase|nr:pantetheine-phosphate adenylyltransferase [Planctomycetaceae bacterium]MCP4813594.1 pantetheine-phosphate adenylyltransferase [Planctomycetaceae bacterium]
MTARIAVYTGSFDPITHGHLNIIQRSSSLFERLVIGIGVNIDKKSLFSVEERMDLARQVTAAFDNVEVVDFEGLAVDFVRSLGAQVMVRGVRPMTDVSGEFSMLLANRQLAPEIETVFLMADSEYAHVSSSLIKQLAPLATDEMLARFIPSEIVPAMRAKITPR